MKLEYQYKIVCGRPVFYPTDEVSLTFLSLGRNRTKLCLSAKDFIEVLKLKLSGVEIVVIDEDDLQLTSRELVRILGF